MLKTDKLNGITRKSSMHLANCCLYRGTACHMRVPHILADNDDDDGGWTISVALRCSLIIYLQFVMLCTIFVFRFASFFSLHNHFICSTNLINQFVKKKKEWIIIIYRENVQYKAIALNSHSSNWICENLSTNCTIT